MQNQTHDDLRHMNDLLQQESYTPEELADLLGITPYRIRHSVRDGELRAFTVDHHIVTIRRADALAWLSQTSDPR